MKHILCYGDSNTWGFDPLTKDRIDHHTRWTRVLGATLGSEYEVVEEGLTGRTTIYDDELDTGKNGRTYLTPCLESHRPLDLVIILLGTNDLKKKFNLSAEEIAQGAGVLVRMVQGSWVSPSWNGPAVLLLAPPKTTKTTEFAADFEGAESVSQQFSAAFKQVAEELACPFLDTSTIIASSPADGIHFEADEHRKLGLALAIKVKELIG